MRKVAWALAVLLFLASAVFFLRYVGIDGHTVPVMRQQAQFSLYMSIATGLLATLAFIGLAVTHQRRSVGRAYDFENEDAAPEPCPECYEPIKGFELSCRACGYRFGPRFGRDEI